MRIHVIQYTQICNNLDYLPLCSGIKISGKWLVRRSPSPPVGPTCTQTPLHQEVTG